jgi:serine/threonine-protein kinase
VLGAERFVQEITTTANLQHPNILPLFDSGEADGFLYYVMPFIEGETLRDKLDRETQLGIDEAVKIATEVADALDYAHRNGVIHRDIKPENILLHDGRPMVADFGIALAVSAAAGGRMTETGMSLGTPHYMSPEQATADKDITARSDVYSLGSVLYEMLTGEPPHMGTSAQAIIMKIVTEEAAPVTKLRKSVPLNVTSAVGKALEKVPADRFGTAAEFSAALKNPAFTTATTVALHSAVPPFRRSATLATLVATTLVATALAIWAWVRGGSGAAPLPVVEFTFDPPDTTMSMGMFALSPDGTLLAAEFNNAAGSALYQRRLDDRAWRVIPGTDGGTFPFFSGDGEWLGFVTSQDHTIRRMELQTGSVRTVITLPAELYGATWGEGNTIIYGTVDRPGAAPALFSVSADGGTPERLLPVSDEVSVLPIYAPIADGVLFTTFSSTGAATVALLSLGSRDVTRLVPGMFGQVDARGHMLYVTGDGVAMMQQLDPRTDTLVGNPRRVADNVAIAFGVLASFSLAADGSLVYQGVTGRGEGLLLVDREGVTRSEVRVPEGLGGVAHPRFSPTGDRIAYVRDLQQDRGSLWIYSLPRGTSQRLTQEGMVADPAWSPDGRTIGYSLVADDDAKAVLVERPASGIGSVTVLLADTMDLWQMAFGVAPGDIIFRAANDLFRATIGRDTVPGPLAATPALEQHPSLSPDGRWLAYKSDETGQDEVYVRSYPDMGPPIVVSIGGGDAPVWSPRGGELFYLGRTGLIAAGVETRGSDLMVTDRTALFPTRRYASAANRNYDVSPDGQLFVVVRAEPAQAVWRVNALGALPE